NGGIGIIRISGKDLKSIAQIIIGFVPKKRKAQLSQFYAENGDVIDQGITLYFPSPHSYTGEDVLELHGHGGSAVMNRLLSRCLRAGARLAQPGEFTLRAFLNNKLDLVQAEGVADIINATTEQAAQCAVRSLQGKFSSTIYSLVQSITQLRVLIEATLDFPEEENEFLNADQVEKQLAEILAELERVFTSSKQGNLLKEGVNLVLVGEPNVGKSSLINQLAEEDIAIVTDIPGTTRDTIQRTIQINGIPFHITDTAGLRITDDIIEKSGIARTYTALEKADIMLFINDINTGYAKLDPELLDKLPANLPRINVCNKIDLLKTRPIGSHSGDTPTVHISAKTGEGISVLHQVLLETIGWHSDNNEGLFMARQRHLSALTEAKKNIHSAKELVSDGFQLELIAEELRAAQKNLNTITGEFTSDDLLGEIFSSFCIGK
ncbi:MAG: tRNA uridine-5-carboxymethylaminomethyl(34) synthesis GTPase MnmE, partial [Nitrosomonas sp.]|nr:tRNA uridine-5-carboxymethylaminomethyl(34) synthesis GTPase MnmE [Nitrosomonas sp.]